MNQQAHLTLLPQQAEGHPSPHWTTCAGSFRSAAERYETERGVAGETTFSDEHGLQVETSWTRYTNSTLGLAGSLEHAVLLRYASASSANTSRNSSLPVCGPYVTYAADMPPPGPGEVPSHGYDWPGPVLVDITVRTTATANVTLHRQLGSDESPDDFSAVDEVLKPGASLNYSVGSGRSSEGDLPVWNLEAENGGRVVALGWSGNWRMKVVRSQDGESTRLVVTPGTLCASLNLGESVSLGRALVVPWDGVDYRLGYVLLRRLLREYKVPRLRDGMLPHYLATESYDRWPERSVENLKRNETSAHWVQGLAARGGLDSYWMDANWFSDPGGLTVGNWQLPLTAVENQLGFPSGIRALFDQARSHIAADGKPMRTIMWTEPERVSAGSYIATHFPEYVLGAAPSVLDLDNQHALRYIEEFVSAAVIKYKLDVWRIDFNTYPADFWFHAGDALSGPDQPGLPFRRGITEAGYVRGLYELWDRVRLKHPGLIIDNCASGGRRHDLETMSRSVPLWPSDYSCAGDEDLGAMQSMTMGLSRWLPVHGGAFLGEQKSMTAAMRSSLRLILNDQTLPYHSSVSFHITLLELAQTRFRFT